MSSSATSAGAGCAARILRGSATQAHSAEGSATASDPEPPTTSRRRARSRNRPSAKTMLTDSGVLVSASMETLAPVPRSMTWKTNAPRIGSVSAEMARHATVYVPSGRSVSIVTGTWFGAGRRISPLSTRPPDASKTWSACPSEVSTAWSKRRSTCLGESFWRRRRASFPPARRAPQRPARPQGP